MKTPVSLIIRDKKGNIQDELFVRPDTVQFARGFVTALYANGLITTQEIDRIEVELGEIARGSNAEDQAA